MKKRQLVSLISLMFCSFTFYAGKPGVINVQNPDINTILNKPVYNKSSWGIRLVNLTTNQVLIDLNPGKLFFIASERKLFPVLELLNKIGPDFTYNTPVYTQGKVTNGVLDGNLILQASGDLTMGGRTLPDGTIAISEYDHNEANTLGTAILTSPDPLAGYKTLARQVAATGINKITGEVIIDDRLFTPFSYRNQFDVRPIFVNDDVIDVIIQPDAINKLASVHSRPLSKAFTVNSQLLTTAPQTSTEVNLNPEFPDCFGKPACNGTVSGTLATDFLPTLTHKLPLVQTFRITNPSNYARTIFIEALREAGVTIRAAAVANNPTHLLPAPDSYQARNQVAKLTGLPYSQYTKYILKVSYNIGADTSLMLYGLTQGIKNFKAALAWERKQLINNYKLPGDQFIFPDGSGDTSMASNFVITQWLTIAASSPVFEVFFNALPVLLETNPDYPSLSGAVGKIHYKSGAYVEQVDHDTVLKGLSMAGYVDTAKNHRLVFQIVVNDVIINSIPEILDFMKEQRMIAAIFWRDY